MVWPASADCLIALRGGEVIPGLTEPLASLPEADWNTALTRLADAQGLISLIRASGRIEQIDSHPLVREYFAFQLRNEHSAAWIEGHRRLYEHLCETTEHQPDTLEGLQLLYQAVAQSGLGDRTLELLSKCAHNTLFGFPQLVKPGNSRSSVRWRMTS